METSKEVNEVIQTEDCQKGLAREVAIALNGFSKPISLKDLSLITDVEVNILSGVLESFKLSGDCKVDYIIRHGKMRGKGYVLTEKGREKVENIKRKFETLKRLEKLNRQDIELQNINEKQSVILFVVSSVVLGFLLGLGLHDWIISLFE